MCGESVSEEKPVLKVPPVRTTQCLGGVTEAVRPPGARADQRKRALVLRLVRGVASGAGHRNVAHLDLIN
ncbi:unnamed protein product [Gadus morhua 'NCC']